MNSPGRAFIILTFISALATTIAFQFTSPYRIAIGSGDSSYVRGFWSLERDGNGNPFRWSRANSEIVFHNAGQILPPGIPITMEVRLASARPEGQEPQVHLILQGAESQDLGSIAVPGVVSILNLPIDRGKTGGGDWTLKITSETFSPQGDGRELGIMVRRATIIAGPGANPVLPPFPTILYGTLTPLFVFLSMFGLAPQMLARKHAVSLSFAAGVVAAIVLAAGIAFNREQTVLYLPFVFLACAALVIWASARILRPAGLQVSRTRRWMFTFAFVLGTFFLVLGESLVWLANQTRAGGLFLVTGAACIFVAMLRPNPGSSWGNGILTGASEDLEPARRKLGLGTMGWPTIGAIVLVGFAMRVYALDEVLFGLFRDETRLGLLAMRVLSDPSYRPVYEGPPISQSGLLIYALAAMFSTAGANIFTLRLVGALGGTLTVPLLWRIANDWFHRPRVAQESALEVPRAIAPPLPWDETLIPFIAAFGLAIGTMHVYYSRFTLPYVESPLLTIPAYILLTRAFKNGRWQTYALAGFFFAAAQYASQVSRVGLLVGAFLVIDEIVIRRGLPRNFIRGASALIITSLIVLSPLLAYVARHPDDFLARTEQVSLFNSGVSSGAYPVGLLWNNVVAYGTMFNLVGDSHGGHVVPTRPEFDPIMSLLFVIGFLYGLVHWRDSRYRRVLFWLFASLLPGILSIEAPAPLRVLETPAPTFIFAGVGGAWLLGQFASLPGPSFNLSRRFAFGVRFAFLGLGALALFANAHVYLGELGNDARLWEKNQAISTPIGATLCKWVAGGQVPRKQIVLVPDWLLSGGDDQDVLNFTTSDELRFAPMNHAEALPATALIVRPNIVGYWKTIIAKQRGSGTIPAKWTQQDAQTMMQIQKLAANRTLTQLTGPNFPDSSEATFWLYTVR